MDGLRQWRVFSAGCAGGPLGPRGCAYANRNTALIHHPVSSEIIKSNYRQLPHRRHLNLPPDGNPAEQQVGSLHFNLRPTSVTPPRTDNGGPGEAGGVLMKDDTHE